jgi:hypothetical protein
MNREYTFLEASLSQNDVSQYILIMICNND